VCELQTRRLMANVAWDSEAIAVQKDGVPPTRRHPRTAAGPAKRLRKSVPFFAATDIVNYGLANRMILRVAFAVIVKMYCLRFVPVNSRLVVLVALNCGK
jgi:hypothetical protein